MATDKALKAAAKELNELGITPPIDFKLPADELKKLIKKAITLLEPDDDLSDELQEIIEELKAPVKKEVPTPAKKKAPVVEEDDTPEPEEEVVDPPKKKKDRVVVEEEDDDNVPVKKGKAEKVAPVAKEKKQPAIKGISASYVVRKLVCENPKITNEQIMKKLVAQKLTMADVSITMRKNEMLAAIEILTELGKL